MYLLPLIVLIFDPIVDIVFFIIYVGFGHICVPCNFQWKKVKIVKILFYARVKSSLVQTLLHEEKRKIELKLHIKAFPKGG